MAINGFDVATGALIFLIGIKGVINGFVKELAGLIGAVLGIWIASLFAEEFGDWLGEHLIPIDSHSALAMIGFLSLLAIVWLGFVILGHLLERSISIAHLGVVDKIFGFLFAAAKVFLIIAVIVYALSNIEVVRKNTETYIHTSRLYPLYIKAGSAILHLEAKGVVKRGRDLQEEAEKFIKKSAKKLSGEGPPKEKAK